MKNIIVYGSLRYGLWNYKTFLSQNKPDRAVVISGFKMYDLGGFPCIVRDSEGSIIAETFREVDDLVANDISRMEIGAGYKEIKVNFKGEDYSMYIFENKPVGEFVELIEGGDYIEFLKEKYDKNNQNK